MFIVVIFVYHVLILVRITIATKYSYDAGTHMYTFSFCILEEASVNREGKFVKVQRGA